MYMIFGDNIVWFWSKVIFILCFFVMTDLRICPFLKLYSAYNGSFLPTFRDNLLVPSSEIKQPKNLWPFKIGPMVCP